MRTRLMTVPIAASLALCAATLVLIVCSVPGLTVFSSGDPTVATGGWQVGVRAGNVNVEFKRNWNVPGEPVTERIGGWAAVGVARDDRLLTGDVRPSGGWGLMRFVLSAGWVLRQRRPNTPSACFCHCSCRSLW